MSHYKIVLEVEDDGNTPEEALQNAIDKLCEDEASYIYFLQNDETGEIVSVDLSEPKGEQVLPVPFYEPLITPSPNQIHEERKGMIKYIREVIKKWGETSSMELELEASPCLSSIGNNKDNVSQLIENFNEDTVMCVTYHGEVEIDSERRAYDGLPDHILTQIEIIMNVYDSTSFRKNREEK